MYNVKSEFKKMFLNNKQIKVILLIFSMMFFASNIYSQSENIYDTALSKKISKAVLEADILSLSEVFHNKVDLALPDKSGIYSKRQAIYVLKEFFDNNKPKSFKLITENKSKGSVFIVGKLQTDKQNFRTCFLTKKEAEATLIYQIRIEE